MKKKLLLVLYSLLLITAFFLLPQNRQWMKERLFAYWNDFLAQKDHPGLEYRKEKRWGTSYTYSRQISRFFEEKGMADSVLVLLPPTSYFKHHGISYHVPEPAVFYYYTGLKTIWANSPKAIEAGWYVRVEDKKLMISPAPAPRAFADTIRVFEKFGVSL